MWDMKRAHYLGALLSLVTIALAASAIGTKFWASYDNDWDVSLFCDLEYKFNWGLYTYDSTTEYVCNGAVSFKRERINYAMNCDVVDDDNCDNLHTAQHASSVALALTVVNLVLYLALALYGSVSPAFLALSAVLTCIQVAAAFTTVGAYSAIVRNYSKVEVSYDSGSGTVTNEYNIDIKTAESWSLMVAAGVLSVVQFLLSSGNAYNGKAQIQQMPAAARAAI